MKKNASKPAAKKTTATRKPKTAGTSPARPARKTKKPGKDDNEEFPGYPHYPATDDIMNDPGEEVLELDMENPEHPIIEEKPVEIPVMDIPPGEMVDPDLVPGTMADVEAEEAQELGDPNLAMDLGDDEDLKHRMFPVDMAATDLEVPGSELDDENEARGSEDEENNFYSHSQS